MTTALSTIGAALQLPFVGQCTVVHSGIAPGHDAVIAKKETQPQIGGAGLETPARKTG
jgi:hypothetical protein